MKAKNLVASVSIAAAVLVVTACGIGSHSPTEPYGCADIAGSWDGSFENSCGNSGDGVVLVTQVGCSFSAVIPTLGGGTVSGQIDGRYADFALYFATPCSGSAHGTATVSSTRIHGSFSGAAHGWGCCEPVTGTFTLLR